MPRKGNSRLYHLRPLCRNFSGSNRYLDEHWQQIELRTGLKISMLKLPSGRANTFCYQKQSAMIDFGFILSGFVDHKIHKYTDNKCLQVSGGLSGIGYLPGWKGIAKISGRERLRALHVHVSPRLLREFLGNELGSMPDDFQTVFNGETTHYLYHRVMDSAIEMIVQEIHGKGLNGSLKDLYLEGKALELIALQLNHLMFSENNKQERSQLSGNERARIQAARDQLVQELSNPPTLAELSSHFYLSLNKLQQGFREVYGKSVFGYLREYKMRKARHLFETAEMNVSQVAWEVGYVNVSHFSKAYKKRFGILPKQYLRSVLYK